MSPTFTQLNHEWNADPNGPDPQAEWDGLSLRLRFRMNSFGFPEFDAEDTRVQVEEEEARGGKLALKCVIHRRVRYLIDGGEQLACPCVPPLIKLLSKSRNMTNKNTIVNAIDGVAISREADFTIG